VQLVLLTSPLPFVVFLQSLQLEDSQKLVNQLIAFGYSLLTAQIDPRHWTKILYLYQLISKYKITYLKSRTMELILVMAPIRYVACLLDTTSSLKQVESEIATSGVIALLNLGYDRMLLMQSFSTGGFFDLHLKINTWKGLPKRCLCVPASKN
jgi:hypothetical protein